MWTRWRRHAAYRRPRFHRARSCRCRLARIRSQPAGLRRTHTGPTQARRVLQRAGRHFRHGFVHWRRVGQRALWRGSKSAWPVHVRVERIRSLRVIVEIIGDVVDVRDPRIGNVHVVEISTASAVPGIERFTKSQRAPAKAHSAPTTTKSETPAPTPSPAAIPAD